MSWSWLMTSKNPLERAPMVDPAPMQAIRS